MTEDIHLPDSTDQPVTVSRAEARAGGLMRYYTGVPCPRGHLSEKMVASKRCLVCHREDRAKLRADAPEKIKAHKAASYLRNREKMIAKSAAYIAANPQKVLARRKAHYAKNRERLRSAYKAWAKDNRDLLRVHERARKMRHLNAPGVHTLADIKAMEKAQGLRCASPVCGKDISPEAGGYHVDHVMPLIRFGCNCPGNLQLLCAPCNQSKHAREPEDWKKGLHASPP